MNAQYWNILGVLSLFVGVVILFFFGMPYRVRRGGAGYILREETDEADLKKERLYDALGWVGLFFMTACTAAQIYASLLN